MEIELTEAQKEAMKAFKGISEEELIKQYINVGILFYSTTPTNRKFIMEILKPE